MLEVCAAVNNSGHQFGFNFTVNFVLKNVAGIYITIISNGHTYSI